MASIFRHAVIHVLTTLVLVAAVRQSMPDPVCEDVEAATKSVYTPGQCVCKNHGDFAMGKGCGNALLKDKFPLGEIVNVRKCFCRKKSCTDFGAKHAAQEGKCFCATEGHELVCERGQKPDDKPLAQFDLSQVKGPNCKCTLGPRWYDFKAFCKDAGGKVGPVGVSCHCRRSNEVFHGDHCAHEGVRGVRYHSSLDVRSLKYCACNFSRGFLEAAKVTAVQFCEAVGLAAVEQVVRQRRPRGAHGNLVQEWMSESWATEICSAVVSKSEEPSEGINQLQTNQRPDENMEVLPKSRAWYLLEGDQNHQPGLGSLKVALKKVCHDECADLVKKLASKGTIQKLQFGKLCSHRLSLAERCATLVVREVESEILGCCARTCGWNGRTCGLWDYMQPADQKDWKLECCAEGAILKGSSRQKMCNSVLPKERQRFMEEHADEPYNTSGLPSFVGQDFDGVDFPSSSASMLEVTQRECEIKPKCHKGQQKTMWVGCAEKYTWNMLDGKITLPDDCNSETSNTRFVDCEPHEEMPHVQWSVINGVQSCTHFDNACKGKIEDQLNKNNLVLTPDKYRRTKANKNPRVFRFIKLSQ